MNPWRRGLRMAAFATLLFSIGFVTALAGTPAGYSEYIVPFDEDVFAYVTDPVTAGAIGANDTTFSLISVTAWSDTVTIYYDHWENGYNYDSNNPDATADEKYVIDKSQTLNFQSIAIPRPRTLADGNTYRGNVASGASPTADCTAQPTPAAPLIQTTFNYCYDGRDRIVSIGGATTLTRGGYLNTAGLGKLAAIGEEVYPLAPQLVKYVLPFGDDPTRVDYERVAALIQATEDNTTIQIDFNADGVFDSFNTENGYRTARADPLDSTILTLQKGQTYILNTDSNGVAGAGLPRGAVILGSKTLQVEYFYGEIDSNYNTRAVSAFPRGFWSNEYYASADGGTGGTDILLYNPNNSSITINWETAVATGSFTMVANETAFFQVKTGAFLPEGSGAYLKGTAAFWGTSDVDQNGANYDWGYSLVPSYLLSDDQVVAWAPGNAPALACNVANGRGNGLFVTPAYDNTTFFIDADGDGAADTNASIEVLRGVTAVTATGSGYKANRLESLYITGSNSGTLAGSLCDLTGARIYATGPFSMSYGENPNKASAGGGLDLGYTVLPSPSNWMDLALTVDKTTSPALVSTVAGVTTVTFTLVVDSHLFNIDGLSVLDTLPANWTYDNNSTTITLPDLTQISGAAANPTVALPNLTWGAGLLGSLLPNQRVTISFTARTTAAFTNGAISQNNVQAIGTRTVGGVTQTFNSRDFAFNTFADSTLGMQLTKASSVPVATPVSPGDTITYTVTVTNPVGTSTNLTGVSLNDLLPTGVTSVPGTTTLSRSSVADAFGANAYTNSNGTRAWASNWTETVEGTNATAGDIQVIAGELRLNNDNSNEPTVFRRVNLAGATSALLSFRYRTTAGVDVGDSVQICGRRQAADPWTCPLAGGDFTGVAGVTSGRYSVNLNTLVGALTATAEIRFQFGNNDYSDTAANESFFVDDLSITYDVSVAGGNPPELLSSAALYTLAPGQSLTATFNVTVDTPFPSGAGEIVNTAASSVNEIPVPLTATARNIVLVPGGGTATVGDRVWLDADADGIFDPGETGIAGVEVTLRDQFGTPVQVTTTDSQGLYSFIDVAPGTGYFVEITAGLPAGLTQTTETVGDAFDVNGVFTGNVGTLAWLTNWTENNDTANATTGDIQIANNRIEFRDTTDGGTVLTGESIQRSATVTGATSLELKYSWDPLLLETDGSDNIIVEYSTNGTTWTPVRTLNGDPAGVFTDTIPWLPTNNTAFVRFRAEDALEAGEQARIDNVQLRFPQSLRTANFNLAAGQEYTQADLGFRAAPGTAAIGDLVWVDANNDQLRNPGEVGLSGITVQLFQDTNADGVPDGPAIATTVTGPGGAYLFTGLAANGTNDYAVTVLAQAPLTGYAATTNVLFYFPNLVSGAVRVDADFGFRNPAGTFTISDGVWLDNGLPSGTANNAAKDGTEAGIAGVTVDLLNSAGFTIATTTTAANGSFQFTGVPGGQNYRWRITDDAGVLADYYGTSASALSGNFQMIGNLTADLNFTATPHFGYNQTRTIGDTVFNDNGAGGGAAGNGIQDGAEAGIAGVTVLLYRNTDGDALFEPGGDDGAVYATQVTDAFGHYQFAGLPTGFEWWVSIDNTQSALSLLTLTTADNSAPVAGHQRRVTPALAGGNNRLDIDYGYRAATPFSISGRLFNDINRSGTDNSETGLGDVTLELVNSSGVVIATTSTDSTGAYTFIGQAAGTYTVRVTDLNGVLAGAETTFEKTEGILAASYNGQETVTLGPTVGDVDFGFYRGNALVTRVVISSVVARDVQGALVLEWTTASEIGTVGFYLKRWDERKDRYVSVNERLIPSLIGSTQGGTYRYVDREASPGEPYRYLIVEVEASGRRLGYGPYDVDSRLTVVKADGEEEDDRAGDAASKRDDDALLLEKGEWKAPHRGNLTKRLERRNAAREEHRRATGRRRSSSAAKIGVSENAFYFVTLQELQTLAGMPASAPWTRTYSLTNRGEPVALAPSAEGDGFWFYGRATGSNLEKDNVYRLSERPGGARMGSRRNPRGEAPSGAEVFPKTLHVERDAIAVNNVFKDPDGDFYMWDYVFAGFGARPFTFRTDGAAGTDRASVTVRLKGGSDTETNPDHHASFSLNGTIIGEATWDGLGDLVTTVDFDGSLLADGENTLVIDGLTDTGAAYSLFYVDSFDVSYTSRYRAHGNRAEVPASGNPSVLISGFTRPDITLFDITDPNHPVFVQAPVVQVPDGTYGVVASSRDPLAVYYALAPDGLVPVSRVLPDKPSSLRSSDNEAQYVVITTEALKDTAQTLADYRSDLSSMVVDVEDIYDEFNSGNASPYAVRAFLAWARTNWRTPPRYVVLAGEGTYDYKDVEGFGDNLIPTMMANTPEGLFPTDTWFVERAGTVREIAIGRLPVATNAELSEVIRKIAVRETALALDEPWLRSTLLVADNTDEGGDFVQSSESVAGLVPAGSPLLRAYISSVGDVQVRAGLLAEVNAGTGLVNYFGHAGFDYLADEQLLKTPDVPALLNRDRPSMMFAFTCLAGNSSLPGYSTLGEELLRQEGGGFAALFAPSGMSANDLATPLAAGLHSALLANDTLRIGDAVNAARRAYKRDNLPLYMLSIYNLLGDPAMRVR